MSKPRFSSRRKYFWWGLGLGAAILFVLLAIPAYRAYNGWRAERLVDAATEAQEGGQLEQAMDLAQRAYALRPQELEVVRALAEVSTAVDPARGVLLWPQVLELSDNAPTDLRAFADAALRAGDTDTAADAITQLRDKKPLDPETLVLRARLAAVNEQYSAAFPLLQQSFQLDPDPSQENLQLYAALAVQIQEATQARAFLQELAKRDDATGLAALRVLTGLPGQQKKDLELMAKRLQEHPLAEHDDQLVALLAETMLGKHTRAEAADIAAEGFDLSDETELAQFGRWLVQFGLSNELPRFLSKERAIKDETLFGIWADAMAESDQWQELSETLRSDDLPIEDATRQLYRMRAAIELGNKREADEAWNAAMAAATSPAQFKQLADYALRMGLSSRAREALWRIADDPQAGRAAFQELLTLEQRVRNTEGLQKVLARMHKDQPNDEAVMSDLAYMNALLNQNLKSSEAEVSALVEGKPEMLPYRMSLAAVQMRLDKPQDALATLRPLNVDWNTQPDRWKLVLCWVLVANNFDQVASDLIGTVNNSSLLPEEQTLYRSLKSEVAGRLDSPASIP